MFWIILITLLAVCVIGIGNTIKALFTLGILALIASAIYLGGFMLLVTVMNGLS